MSDQPKSLALDKKLLLKLALGGLLALLLTLAALHFAGFDLLKMHHETLAWTKDAINTTLDFARGFGPVAFFLAMTILPAFGFPMAPFTLSSGPLFAPQLGIVWVIVIVLLCIALNLALSYWLARYALRPLLSALLRKLGYQLPEVARENGFNLTVILRVTPGSPFFVQNYLLGLAEVPFKVYMGVSWAVSALYAVTFVIFGDAMLHGKGRNALFAMMMLAGVIVAVQWVRKNLQKKKAAQP